MIFEFDAYYIDAIQEKDAWRLCDFVVANSERLKTFFPKTLKENLTPDLASMFVQKKVKEFIAKKEFLFTIRNKNEKSLIGLVYIKELDWKISQAELAYAVAYQFEGKGIATKAVNALSQWAFNEQQLKTLQILVHETNKGSISVAKKSKYVWVKTLPEAFTPPGSKPLDMELYELYS